VHPLEIPVIWFGIQFIELALIGPIPLWAFLGDDWPNLAAIAITVAVLIGLTVINYKLDVGISLDS